MPSTKVAGIRLDRLPGARPYTFIDLVPPNEQGAYVFRATHLGGLALNLVHGRPIINRGRDRPGWNERTLEVHVAASHRSAVRFAMPMSALTTDPMQFRKDDAHEFERLAGMPADGIPGIVLGLPRAIYEARMQESRLGVGFTLNEEVPIANIDPFSRGYLEYVLETCLSA